MKCFEYSYICNIKHLDYMINAQTELTIYDKKLRISLYKVYNGKCFYTGRNLSIEDIHVDHILPKSKGGRNCIENYVLCCADINVAKKDIVDDYFVERITLINNLLFCNKVVDEYNSLTVNGQLLEGYVNVNDFVKKKQIQSSARNKFVQSAKRNLKYIEYIPTKRNRNGSTIHNPRKRFYFEEKALVRFYENLETY